MISSYAEIQAYDYAHCNNQPKYMETYVSMRYMSSVTF